MRSNHTFSWLAILLVIASLGAAQLGCSVFGRQQAGSPAQPGSAGQGQQGQDDPGPNEDSGLLDDPSGEQAEAPVEPQFGDETLDCPPEGTILALGFDHALTVNHGDVTIHHFLHQGWVNLEAADASGALVSVGSTSLKTSMEGRMGDRCTLTGEGSMIPNAHGTCEAGVVSLIIEENWLPIEGQMTCIDEDGDVETMPFNVPAMGIQTHSGPGGGGEIFYLVEGSEGYSSMRPFAEGEGYHTWTLYVADMPPVPLVPQD